MTQTVLILGANGRFGRNAALQFENAGWEVRRFDRGREDLNDAARGADVIVNAWNPPYTDWARTLPELHDRVIKAARANGATVIVPGNVYVFGSDTPAPWNEHSQHRAQNALGRIRINMETAYRNAGVRTILLRAGDFIDTEASGNWFDKIMTPGLAKGVFTYPGNAEIPHAWAYLPDLCRAAVELAEMRSKLPVFSDIPFGGYTMTGTEIAASLAAATGRNVRVKKMSWLPLYIAQPFWRMASSLLEMRYLWNTPHWLDDTLFRSLLPGFQRTDPDDALKQVVEHMSIERKINPNQAVTAGG